MLKRHRNRILGALAILAAIAAAILPEMLHKPETLLTKAHRVGAVGKWDPKRNNYFWLSNREVLLLTSLGGAYFQSIQAQRLNAQTGTATADATLGHVLNKINSDTLIPEWQLSPDARWLLADNSCLKYTRSSLIATAIDGSKQIVRPRQEESGRDSIFAVWRPDSKSWVQLYEQANVVHAASYRLDTPAIVYHVENTDFDGSVPVGFYSRDRIFCIRPQTGDGGGVGVMDYGVDPASAPVKNYIQAIPANFDIQEVVLSPDRTQLAWKFTVKSLPLGIKETINSSYVRRSAPNKAGLWVSDLNFSHLREIGTVDIDDDHISNLRWMPDGRQLSFINDGALYTAPVY